MGRKNYLEPELSNEQNLDEDEQYVIETSDSGSEEEDESYYDDVQWDEDEYLGSIEDEASDEY